MRERCPQEVPDDDPPPVPRPVGEFTPDLDTDLDGRPDTLVTDDGTDLLVVTDLDGDGLADRTLRIGGDGIVRELPGAAWVAPDVAPGGLDAGLTD